MVSSLFKNIYCSFHDFIFPPICFLCDKSLIGRDGNICEECWSGFTKINKETPAYVELEKRLLSSGYVKYYTTCYLFEREGKFQEAIHLLKYRGIKSIGKKLGMELGNKILNANWGKIDYVIPVPLHKLKKRERGYNQCDYICKGISQVLESEFVSDLIQREKFTESQTKLNFQERRDNVAEAFTVNLKYKNLLADKNCLIVDDIITTGATIEETARVLAKAGVNSVYAASAGTAKGMK